MQQMIREIERLQDTWLASVYRTGDVPAAVRLLADGCALANLPAGTGGTGVADIEGYLARDVVPHRPADLALRRVSRTVDTLQLVDELRVRFTHDVELPWLLPGVPPTGRPAEVLAVSVVVVRQARITAHRTLWDHAALLDQLDLAPRPAGGAGAGVSGRGAG
jgi:carboxymethylenebutenolidase